MGGVLGVPIAELRVGGQGSHSGSVGGGKGNRELDSRVSPGSG